MCVGDTHCVTGPAPAPAGAHQIIRSPNRRPVHHPPQFTCATKPVDIKPYQITGWEAATFGGAVDSSDVGDALCARRRRAAAARITALRRCARTAIIPTCVLRDWMLHFYAVLHDIQGRICTVSWTVSLVSRSKGPPLCDTAERLGISF